MNNNKIPKSKEKIYYVYEWFIVPTGEVFYVGKGKNNRYKETRGRNKFFLYMYNNHDCDVRFVFENMDEQQALDIEVLLIAYYKEFFPSYRLTNLTSGGDGTSRCHIPEEERKRRSAAFKEKWNRDSEFRDRIKRIRSDPDGPYKSKGFREKISKLVKGENNPNYGHRWTDEMKEKASKRIKESGCYKDEKNPRARRIKCVETGEEFACIKHAMEKYNLKNGYSFTAAIDRSNRTAAGLHWESC